MHEQVTSTLPCALVSASHGSLEWLKFKGYNCTTSPPTFRRKERREERQGPSVQRGWGPDCGRFGGNTLGHSPTLGRSSSRAPTCQDVSRTSAPRAVGQIPGAGFSPVAPATWYGWAWERGGLLRGSPDLGQFSESCFLLSKKAEFATE